MIEGITDGSDDLIKVLIRVPESYVAVVIGGHEYPLPNHAGEEFLTQHLIELIRIPVKGETGHPWTTAQRNWQL